MPSFYFATVDQGTACDGIAIELPDIDAARAMAVAFASDLLREIGLNVFSTELEVRVTDEDGLILFTLALMATEAPILRH